LSGFRHSPHANGLCLLTSGKPSLTRSRRTGLFPFFLSFITRAPAETDRNLASIALKVGKDRKPKPNQTPELIRSKLYKGRSGRSAVGRSLSGRTNSLLLDELSGNATLF